MLKAIQINRVRAGQLAVSFVLLSILSGCRGNAAARPGWVERSILTYAEQANRDATPRLQILISYDRIRSTHSAVRVTGGGLEPVFWDPGGNYGGFRWPSGYGRVRDVVLEKPPTLLQWWRYRTKKLGEDVVQVFEWDVQMGQAVSLQKVLIEAATAEAGRPFDTDQMPGMCNLAVGRFLNRFGPPAIDARRLTLWPDALAGQLWQQHPDRVLIYRDRPEPRMYTPRQAVASGAPLPIPRDP